MMQEGHEDRTLAEQTIAEGGAVVTVTVEHKGQRWRGQRIVPGSELRTAIVGADQVVRAGIERIARTFHFESERT